MKQNEVQEEFFCERCQQECHPVCLDFGIGYYEFWGEPCIDVRLAVVSDCCNETVYTERHLDTEGHFILEQPTSLRPEHFVEKE